MEWTHGKHTYPDHQRAQLYATLSMEGTLRDVVAQLADLAEQMRLADRAS